MSKLLVKTQHSQYVVDTIARTFARTPISDEANPAVLALLGDAPLHYLTADPIEVGKRMYFVTFDSWVRSTPVVEIIDLTDVPLDAAGNKTAVAVVL